MLTIKGWDETFENSQTRKCSKRMGWIATPTGCDSIGYVRLMSKGESGVTAFGVFNAILQWSAARPIEMRGKLVDSNGTDLSVGDLSALLRIPSKTITNSLEALVDVGWIITNSLEPSRGLKSPLDASLPHNTTRHDKTRHDKTKQDTPAAVIISFDRFWESYPKNRRRSKAAAKKAWNAAIKKTDPETIIEAAGAFSQSVEGNSEYCPGPAPWLNQERWDDDREAWNRGNTQVQTARRQNAIDLRAEADATDLSGIFNSGESNGRKRIQSRNDPDRIGD